MIGRLSKLPLFWPVLTLALLIALNASLNPGFLAIAWRDGHLYGSLIDILNRAAPLALVSTGMTLVIAARGLDISVGAVVAISAAVAAVLIGGSLDLSGGEATTRFPMWFALVAALGVAFAMIAAAHLFVVLYEEPNLERRFGDSYREYRQTTPRWIPRW